MTERATREGYGDALIEIGKDKRIVVLDADLSESTRSKKFKDHYPERFINVGISEQDLIGTAAGLAASGKIPFASSFAVFITGRAYDQIRLNAGISHLNIKIVGSHAGLLTGEDGASHQSLEDVSMMRAIPGMTIIQPADYTEAKKAVVEMAKYDGPVYLRLGRGKVEDFNDTNYEFKIGKGVVLRNGNDCTIAASGSTVGLALKAHDELKKEGIITRVINIHTIKPIDNQVIIKAALETKMIVTVEDHNIIGGLGSAVAEILSENCPAKLHRIGINDVFGESGSPAELYEKYGLNCKNIVKTVKSLMRDL